MDDDTGGAAGNNSFAFETPVVAEGFAYWQSKCCDGILPSRASISPAEIPRLLPNVVLLDVQKHPAWDFHYRLIGTRIVDHSIRDYTGKFMSEIDYQCAPSTVWNNCITVAESAIPLFGQTPYVGPLDDFRRCEDIILPLSDDGSTVHNLLMFVEYIARA